MRGQVLFMHTFYYPGKEEMNRRADLQQEINNVHAQIYNEVNRLECYRRFYFCMWNKRYNEEMRKKIKVVTFLRLYGSDFNCS